MFHFFLSKRISIYAIRIIWGISSLHFDCFFLLFCISWCCTKSPFPSEWEHFTPRFDVLLLIPRIFFFSFECVCHHSVCAHLCDCLFRFFRMKWYYFLNVITWTASLHINTLNIFDFSCSNNIAVCLSISFFFLCVCCVLFVSRNERQWVSHASKLARQPKHIVSPNVKYIHDSLLLFLFALLLLK